MYVRFVKSVQKHGTYYSIQIVESYRDPKKSKYPITRVIAHLGQVDSLTDRDVDNIINGLCKAIGRTTSKDVSLECCQHRLSLSIFHRNKMSPEKRLKGYPVLCTC